MSALCLTYGVSVRGQKIEQRLGQIGRSARWLAKEIGVSPQTVLNWIDGARPQRDELWDRVARALGVEKADLLDDTRPLVGDIGAPRYPAPVGDVEIPRWPALPANELWSDDPSDCTDFIPIPAFLARSHSKAPERVAAYIQGTSMEPRLMEGDLVIIELVKVARTGRLVLAKSEAGRTVKVLKRTPAGLELHSINPNHGPAVAPRWEVEGYVIAIIRDYEKGRGIIEWDDAGLGP